MKVSPQRRATAARTICALLIISIFCLGMIVAGCGDVDKPSRTPVTPLDQITPTMPPTPDLQPKPTDQVPRNYDVGTDIEKDPITGEVSVRVAGGEGMQLLDYIIVDVTSENGNSDEEILWNPKVGDEAKLKGDPTGKDRVTVTKGYKNGEEYVTDDKVLEGRDTASSGGSSTGGGGGSC
jgi:hypothetical protein